MLFFLMWMNAAIFGVVFAPSLPVMAVGEFLCGISWGVFQVSIKRILISIHCLWTS